MTEAAKPGQTADAQGNPAIDPTKNVLDLVKAAIERQDDLRHADERLDAASRKGIEDRLSIELDAIRREFTLIESRRVEQKTDTKVAVDAALSAAKDAVKEQAAASEKAILKSETSAGEYSKQNAATFTAAIKGVTDGMDDLKLRVGKMETRREAATEGRENSRAGVGVIVGVIASIFGFVSLIIAVVTVLKT